MSLDPLSKDYPSLSDYSYVGNSPITFIDPDGKKIIIHYDSGKRDENGGIIYKQYEYGSKLEVPDNECVVQAIAALDQIKMVDEQTL
ncbi:MAG: hypothetical protein AB8B53_13505 [Flavobacteriales bacterium]